MPKVLIIAYTELAASIKDALDDEAEVSLPEFLPSAGENVNPLSVPSSGLLCQGIFSVPEDNKKEQSLLPGGNMILLLFKICGYLMTKRNA